MTTTMQPGETEARRAEFELVRQILSDAGQDGALPALVAVAHSPTPVCPGDPAEVEGTAGGGRVCWSGYTLGAALRPFAGRGYVVADGLNIGLTDVGRAFVAFLEARAYVVDRFGADAAGLAEAWRAMTAAAPGG